jgi:MSHA biogenesis protein MshO
MNRRLRARGFTLVEIVVAVAIASVVIVFSSMFIAAPIGAYQAQSKRTVLVTDVEAAWPRMRDDLRLALPNSIRWRRNGNYVVVEMLAVDGLSRYIDPMGASFKVSGTVAGGFPNFGTAAVASAGQYYLSVNNRGTGVPNADAYQLAGSITPARVTFNVAATTATGEPQVTVTSAPAPSFAAGDSPRRRVYLVREPVTFLCDESLGTLRRYSGYAISAAQTSRDAPNEFAGATNQLIARGLTTCSFNVFSNSDTQPQTVAVRLTAVRNGGETVSLMHSVRGEYSR